MKDLQYYLELAVKVIKKYGHRSMLRDDDAIGIVANYMMKSDANFNGNGNANFRRVQYGRFGILRVISKYKKSNARKILSMDYIVHDSGASGGSESVEFIDLISSKESTPIEAIIKSESKPSDLVRNSSTISARQRDCIHKYYIEGYTLQSLGDEYGVTKEAIRLDINKGLNKLRYEYRGYEK